MKTALIILSSASLSFCLISCNERSEENKPAFVLTAPYNSQEYQTGDTIFISGDVSDNHALHELDIILTKESGESVLQSTPVVHSLKSYHIDLFYVPVGSAPENFNLSLSAWDHNNNKTELSYTLHRVN